METSIIRRQSRKEKMGVIAPLRNAENEIDEDEGNGGVDIAHESPERELSIGLHGRWLRVDSS